MQFAYAVFAVFAFRNVIEEIFHWSPNLAAESKAVQQFSLRSMFVVMTAVALTLAAQRLLVQLAGNDAEILYIDTHALINAVLSAIGIAWFIMKQRQE